MTFRIFFIFLLIYCVQITGQTNYSKADEIALNYEGEDETIQELAMSLSKDLTTDEEKVRVFYMWMANAIRYDCKKLKEPRKPIKISSTSIADAAKKKQELYFSYANYAFKKKKGVCGDYSHLFQQLCDAVAIESVVITGYARNKAKPFANVKGARHAWNAVKLNNEWKFIETTWGAGYATGDCEKFVRRVTDGFFFVPPELMVLNHLPKEEKWQLLDDPISLEEQIKLPMISYAQPEAKIKNFAKALEKKKNQYTVWFEFVDDSENYMIMPFNSRNKLIVAKPEVKEGKYYLTFEADKTKVVHFSVMTKHGQRTKAERIATYQVP